jgi:hypothetical protein
VSPSTAPPLDALTKLSPLVVGMSDAIRTSVNGSVPVFVTVYVKVTGSPTSAALGETEVSIEIAGGAHGLISSGEVCCAVNADITKL